MAHPKVKLCPTCGYNGIGMKMAFDVTPAWNFLQNHGFVYTIRPSFRGYEGGQFYRDKRFYIHVHRQSKFTGHVGIKTPVARGSGYNLLLEQMEKYVKESGFSTPSQWMSYLIGIHGLKNTTKEWIIYKVEVKLV